MACLSDRKRELRALVDQLSRADEATVTSGAITARLTPIASCADADALLARARIAGAEATPAVQKVRTTLATVKAMEAAGRYRDALPLADAAVRDADLTGYAWLQADALYWYGSLQERSGEPDLSEQTFYRALAFADASGNDKTRAQIWIGLLYGAERRRRFDRIELYEVQAMSALARGGGDPQAEADVLDAVGDARLTEGKLEASEEALSKALALHERLNGAHDVRVAFTKNALGAVLAMRGDRASALRAFEGAIATAEQVVGPAHPRVGTMRNNLGVYLYEGLEFERAREELAHAVVILEAAVGPDHHTLANALDGYGDTLYELGMLDDAIRLHERAHAMWERLQPDHPRRALSLLGLGEAHLKAGDRRRAREELELALALPRNADDTADAEIRFALAEALWETHGDRARARALAAEAESAYATAARAPIYRRELARVRAWRARHP
jgi:tetratricopeptide (TPR) repeat protein